MWKSPWEHNEIGVAGYSASEREGGVLGGGRRGSCWRGGGPTRSVASRVPGGADRGVALLMVILIGTAFTSTVLLGLTAWLTGETRDLTYRLQREQGKNIAEGGIEIVSRNIQQSLKSTFDQSGRITDVLNLLDSLAGLVPLDNESVAGGTRTIRISTVTRVPGLPQRRLTFLATAQFGRTTTSVLIRRDFGFARSPIFEHAFFMNNDIDIRGGMDTMRGEIRSNGNVNVRKRQSVSGDVYAGGIIDESHGSISYPDLPTYFSTAPLQARPGDPTSISGAAWPGGYDAFAHSLDPFGTTRNPARPQLHPSATPIPLPYLGDINFYQQVATTQNGTIQQGGATLVKNVYNGNLVLTGTPAAPLVITGPVVITGDVIIRGNVSGRGTIYSGRNTHVVGDLVYQYPPRWPKPDSNPDQTNQQNSSADFLVLTARSNIVLGDYKHGWGGVLNDIQPPQTAPYQVTAADGTNGYISYYQGGAPFFNGDYTQNDGGTKTDGRARKFYESSLSDHDWDQLHPTNNISQVDAVLFNNHLTAGSIGDANINGGVIGRYEALALSNSIKINFDYRLKEQGLEFIQLPLPPTLSTPQLNEWRMP